MSARIPDNAGDAGAAFIARCARSSWRLPTLLVLGLGLPLGALYGLRGMQGVVLGVGGLAAAGVFLLGFARPFVTLLLSFYIYGSGLDAMLPGPVAMALLVVVTARVVFDVISGQSISWGTPSFKVSLAVLLAIALTSLMMARSLSFARGRIEHILWGIMFFAGITAFATRTSRLRAVLLILSLAFATSILIRLFQFLRSSGAIFLLYPTGEARFGVGDPNFTAVLGSALLVTLASVLGKCRRWQQLALVPVVLLHLVAIVLSASRMGMGLLAFVTVILLVRARRARWYILGGLVVVGIVLINLPRKYWLRFTDLQQVGGIVVERSLQLRMHALEAGWEMFQRHPWFGIGLGNFPAESPRYMSVPLWAHNTYLDVAVTLGIFGLLAFLVWLLSGMEMVARAARLWGIAGRGADRTLAVSIGLSFGVICLAALTLDLAFHPIVWILLGLANAARQCAEAGTE